jgi:deferrochelatase/peroxidase EfeB
VSTFLTVTIPFAAANAPAVDDVLKGLGNPPRADVQAALIASGVVHFMSINVVPGDARSRAQLLIEATVDGSEDDAIESIVSAIGDELDTVLAAAGVSRDGRLVDLLRGHSRALGSSWWSTVGLPFAGTPYMSVARIRAEAELATHVAGIVALLPAGGSAYQRLERTRDILWHQGDWKWAFVPEPAPILAGAPDSGISPLVRPFFGEAVANKPFDPIVGTRTAAALFLEAIVTLFWPLLVLPLIAFSLALSFRGATSAVVAFGIVSLVELALIYVRFRRLEDADEADDVEPSVAQVEAVMTHETFTAQNLLYSVSTLKPGGLRGVAARLAFWSVGLVGRFCRPGFLGSNRMIHFARWLIVPGTDKLVFLSNYDGTWNGYVGDFVLNAAGAHGVTSIWSNCKGFPRTNNLAFGGAADRDRLVRWARRQQRPVRFWFSGYPTLTTDRIRANAAIRQGLASAQSQADAEDWLACFGSAPRPPDVLQHDEMPTIVFGGLPNLRFAKCFIVELDGDALACRRWLRWLEARLTYGEMRDGSSALVAGLACTALAKLGVTGDDLATFPVAFHQGMTDAARSRQLGDVGDHAPAKWRWGQPAGGADMIVVAYARTALRLSRMERVIKGRLSQLGHAIAYEKTLQLRRKGPHRHSYEPFGFVDGIGQPVLRGTWRARREGLNNDVVAAGELVLGYPDAIDRFPPSPSIAAVHDPQHWLADVGTDPRRQRPDASRAEATGRRDIGRNGTYLVVRHLEQDVDAFEQWLDREARRLESAPSMPRDATLRRELIAAKLVGRWRDGTSLVRNDDKPGTAHDRRAPLDNDFMYGRDDPHGLRCPLGAHIRRANPRDGLAPGAEQLAMVNRHRMLRVGRMFARERGKLPGLMFMCVNADIERQFEFVQQTWLLEPSFHGLERESDGLIGHGDRIFTIPTHDGPLCLRTLADFVKVRGGGYFFVAGRAAFSALARYR